MSIRARKFLVALAAVAVVTAGGCSDSGTDTTESPGPLFTGAREDAVPPDESTTTTTVPETTTTLYWDGSKPLPPVDDNGNVVPASS